uniref:Uncharacterized protein n=1 Tax=Zea mays TaxID=4577 RepID=A0A804R8D7_MAIZE
MTLDSIHPDPVQLQLQLHRASVTHTHTHTQLKHISKKSFKAPVLHTAARGGSRALPNISEHNTGIVCHGHRRRRHQARCHGGDLHLLAAVAPLPGGATAVAAALRAAVVRVRGDLDEPELLGDRVQQVHPRPEAVQLAVPDLAHHDPHGLLRAPGHDARPRPPRRRRPVLLRSSPAAAGHDAAPLRLLRAPHRRALRALALVLQLRLHLPLRLLHPDAQGADARRRLLPRRRAPHRRLPPRLHAQHARHLRGRRRRRLRRGALRRVRRRAAAARRRRRGHQARAHPDPPHLPGRRAQPHHLALLRRALLPRVPRRPLVRRRAAQAARRRARPPRRLRLRHQLALRLRAQPRRVPAGRQDLRAHHERRRRRQGLAAHRLLVDGHQGHRHARQPRRLRHRLPRRRLLQPRQAAGAQGQGGREEGGGQYGR